MDDPTVGRTTLAGQSEPLVILFGFNIRMFTRIVAMNEIEKGRRVGVWFWKNNPYAFDPFDEIVPSEHRHKKVSYERVFEVAGIDAPKDFEPGVNPLQDAQLIAQLVEKYHLLGW